MAKIVILGSAYPLRGGGLATFNERLALAFQQMGNKVSIYTFSLQYPSLFFPGKTQYSDEPKPENLDIRTKVNSINPFNWFRVGKELKKERPDILVIRYWLPFMAPCLGTIARIAKKNKHTKVISIADNIIPHERRPGDNLLNRFFVSKMDGFVTMSKTVLNDLKKYNKKNVPVAFCHHPLYDNFGEKIDKILARKMLNIDPGGKYVLFFGFIRDYKGLDLLLKAFAQSVLKDSEVKLLVAGEFYSQPEKYLKLIEDLQIDNKVILHTDFIPNNKVAAYFSAADLVAQPYKSATQSGVTQVAYHFEVPMLVTNVGGLAEMVLNNKTGYVVERDERQIALAIAEFFNNKNTEKKFILNMKEHKKQFSWSKMVNTIISVSGKS